MVGLHSCSVRFTSVCRNPSCRGNGPSPASSFSEAAYSTGERVIRINVKIAFNDCGRGYFGIPGFLESSS